uniref:(northern house mosquito) hypothetical protein n=1 Tax=Culex pipiens TaxID=7175 RepID=A0A8D8A086_CULPI
MRSRSSTRPTCATRRPFRTCTPVTTPTPKTGTLRCDAGRTSPRRLPKRCSATRRTTGWQTSRSTGIRVCRSRDYPREEASTTNLAVPPRSLPRSRCPPCTHRFRTLAKASTTSVTSSVPPGRTKCCQRLPCTRSAKRHGLQETHWRRNRLPPAIVKSTRATRSGRPRNRRTMATKPR